MQQNVRKNYISLVSDAPENEQPAGRTPVAQPDTTRSFVGRLTDVLKRRLPGTPGPTITS